MTNIRSQHDRFGVVWLRHDDFERIPDEEHSLWFMIGSIFHRGLIESEMRV